MRYPLVALTFAAMATHAFAEEAYTAKSLFFSANDSVVAIGTSNPADNAAAQAVASGDAPVTAASGSAPTVLKVAQKKKRPSSQLGASYFVRLKNPDGTTQDVLTRRVFHSGEKFQLGVKVNRPSYVYILNEAPDGKVTQIYPQPSQDNFVDAMGVVFFPAKGAFQFDDKPGMEKLMVYLSPERAHDDVTRRVRTVAPDLVTSPMLKTADAGACPAGAGMTTTAASPAPAQPANTPSLDPAAAMGTTQTASTSSSAAPDTASMQLASASSDFTSKGINFAPDAPSGCAPQIAQADSGAYTSKDIVFADDQSPAPGQQVASYVVKHTTRTDSALFLKINLAHQ
ncbi:DUF4384 domain-containing protein [Paraburkholderia hospita]|uniref:DUF4384 domain-containing protein n=1 Tax=Paraburkholderia hospita TaxID=169430 RepID=UPI000DEFFC4F|nr:DUF4384 domain-containing protein [Paraburkholderia hospita]AXF03942.1 hypothetical protein CUJ88_36300 [Paraburkholderia hospita]